ncbi:hypothetical protein V6Z12_A13G220500 [Gossypium hirsutum]
MGGKNEKRRNKQQPWWFSVCQICFAFNRWCRLSVCLIGGYFPIFECLYLVKAKRGNGGMGTENVGSGSMEAVGG